MTRAKIIAAAGAAVLAVAVSGCGRGVVLRLGPAAPPPPGAAVARRLAIAERHAPVPGARQVFGHGCHQLAGGGPDGAAALAALPAMTAISRIPQLSVLDRAVTRAGLAGQLNSARSLTIFAPDNAAFTTVGPGVLHALLATPGDLRRTVSFQVVAGRVTPAQLAGHRKMISLGHTRLHATGRGAYLGANNASVVCGNVRTANATLYITDRLIVPAGSATAAPAR